MTAQKYVLKIVSTTTFFFLEFQPEVGAEVGGVGGAVGTAVGDAVGTAGAPPPENFKKQLCATKHYKYST